MRNTFILVLFLSCFQSLAQKVLLFDDPAKLDLVSKCGDYIYNNEFAKADSAIVVLANRLPGHPVIHLMRAINIGWKEMPLTTTSEVFPAHYAELQKVIESALKLQELDPEGPDGIFFEMSARGLLAEYYAREGTYLKALGEARKMYGLVRLGFDFVDENKEFLFSTGLYNYFREMYPLRHPIYKPFVWVFKSGDMETGLAQLDKATREAKMIKIEASLYLAYIYLRYENQPLKALVYLEKLANKYPKNNYFKSKLLECLFVKLDYSRAFPLMTELMENEDPYYKMCGEVYFGQYQEKLIKDYALSEKYYEQALETGKHYIDKGIYFRGLAYLGLGRLNKSRGNNEAAKIYFQKVIELNESDVLNQEAKDYIKELR